MRNRLNDYRRTGRTTEIYAVAMANLLTTGECVLTDHVEGETDTDTGRKFFIRRFMDGYNAFLQATGNGKLDERRYTVEKINLDGNKLLFNYRVAYKVKMKNTSPEWASVQCRLALKFKGDFQP